MKRGEEVGNRGGRLPGAWLPAPVLSPTTWPSALSHVSLLDCASLLGRVRLRPGLAADPQDRASLIWYVVCRRLPYRRRPDRPPLAMWRCSTTRRCLAVCASALAWPRTLGTVCPWSAGAHSTRTVRDAAAARRAPRSAHSADRQARLCGAGRPAHVPARPPAAAGRAAAQRPLPCLCWPAPRAHPRCRRGAVCAR